MLQDRKIYCLQARPGNVTGWDSKGAIIIMEICKAPTMRLKALNKHSVTHIMYIEMENVISNLTKS